MNDYIKNPFLQNFKLPIIEVIETSYEVNTKYLNNGQVGKHKKVVESYFIEQQEKVSVYKIPYMKNVLFKELKSAGRDILLYIICTIKDDNDIIELNASKVAKDLNISKVTVYSGINQLIDIAVICKKFKSDYWVNPVYIFKGDRISFYNAQCDNCTEIKAKVYKDINGIRKEDIDKPL